MKKAIILGILVLGLVLGFGLAWLANAQEEQSKSKIISSKELLKELRDPDSKRLKAWEYLSELDIALTPIESWCNLDEKIMPKLIALFLTDPDMANYLGSKIQEYESNEPSLYENPLYQNFEYDKFEQTFSQARSVFKKIVIVIQESLDPSQEEHQKVLQESTELLKKLENPDLLLQQPSQLPYFPQYSDHLRIYSSFEFIKLWAEQKSILLDKDMMQEICNAALAIERYAADNTVDHNSDEFKEKFAEYQKNLQEKFNKLIQFIETLPEK